VSAESIASPAPARARSVLAELGEFDWTVLGPVIAGYLLLYLPTYWSLASTIWQSSDQSQGPLMLGASMWMLYDRRAAIAAVPARPRAGIASVLLLLGLLLYAVGRSQGVWVFEVGSQLVVISGLLLLFKGWGALRVAWFPIAFLLFMVPLPAPLVSAVTGPLKAGVSYVASEILYACGYPVSRTGVILTAGQYLILVADACAGLTSMFSLEAVGLLYLSIVKHPSVAQNTMLSMLLVPIAFCANVVRVITLVLVTYYLGDAAGQGFLHKFAGMVLFCVALMLIVPVDRLIGRVLRSRGGR
jgi:exosortase B